MKRRIWAQIDLDALKENYHTAQTLAGVKVMPVVKSDAYGHGAVHCARTLAEAGADRFAVDNIDEALELRAAGIEADILIFGYTPPNGLRTPAAGGLTQCVMSLEYAKELSSTLRGGHPVRVHIKLDTGMARLGLYLRDTVAVESCAQQILQISCLPGLMLEGVYSHFAAADEPDSAFTVRQAELFDAALTRARALGVHIPICHCANSAGIINFPQYRYDMVREGIMLYGQSPGNNCRPVKLRPVMEVRSRVIFTSRIFPGETVGYGRSYTALHEIPVAVLSAGYADGYLRTLSGCGRVLVGRALCPVIGRVCMDQLMVDISAAGRVSVGDEAVLLGGSGPDCGELAAAAGTISYELLCSIGNRVERVYMHKGKRIWSTHR